MKRIPYTIIIAAMMMAFIMPASVFAQGPPVTLTGHTETDFGPGSARLDDPTITGTNPPGYDVGLPTLWPVVQYPSGWDVEHLAFFYDGLADTMYVGFNYFDTGDVIEVFPGVVYNTLTADVVAGDPDNDLDPSNTSAALNDRLGVDVPNLGDGETILLVIDTNLDNIGDAIVGVPQASDVSGFQIATYTDGSDLQTPGDAFGAPITSSPATLAGNPSAAFPDFQFFIENFSQLPNVQFDPLNDCTFDAQYFAFSGSIVDDGIGEDFIPGVNEWAQFTFDAVRPQVDVVKDQSTTTPIEVGDQVVYHITISNPGCSEMTVVPFEDTFDPTYLQFVSSTLGAPDATAPGSVSWNDVTTVLGDIPVDGSVEFDITFQALNGTPVDGFTTNTGTSEGAEDGNGNGAPTDGDGADTTIYEPGIGVVKTAGTAADGAIFYVDTDTVPANVTFHYEVTNTGNTYLSDIAIVDDRGTPGDNTDDVTIDSTQCAALAGPLAPGGSLTCDIALPVDAPFPVTNIGVATGTPSDGNGTPLDGIGKPTDNDDAVVDDGNPGISIIKTAGTAADGDTLNITQAGLVTYHYTVRNTGDTYLSDITIVDDHGTPGHASDDVTITSAQCAGLAGPLAPNATVNCTADIQVNKDVTNIATATGNPTDSGGDDLPGLDNPTDDDDAIVDVFLPGLDLQKTVYLGQDGGASCGSAGELVTAGQGLPVTYCFVVTNTGDTYLDDVTVTDATLGGITLDKNNGFLSGTFPLSPAPNGGQAVFYYETTLAQDLVNTASATGVPTESDGTILPGYDNPADDDTAEVDALYLSLGNRVFRDEGAGANFNNGVQDGDEGGLGGVQLRLLNGDGSEYDADPNTAGVQPYDVTTDGDGYYSFDGLSAGSYRVRVLAANFSGALAGYASSTDIGSTADPENDTDQDDNGIGAATSGDVDSGAINLVYDAEPTGEETASGPDADAYTNYTLDFGFWEQRFDLALRKTPVSSSAAPGSDVVYQITVFNQGTLDASNIGVTDYIPNGMTYSSSNVGSVTSTNGGASVSITDNGDGTFVIDALPMRDSVTFEITLTLSDTFQDDSITNWAEIDSADGGTDVDSTPDSSNQNTPGEAAAEVVDDDIDNSDGGRGDANIVDEDDHDLAIVSVGQTFDLALRKQPATGQSVSPGEDTTFVITVFNQGTLNATAIGVTDYIPAGTSYKTSNVTTVTTTDNGAPVSISDDGGGAFTIDTLATGDSVSFDVTLTLDVNFQGDSVTNWAEIDSADGGTDVDSTPDSSNQNTPGEQTGEIVDDDIDNSDDGLGNPDIVDEDDHDLATVAANQFDWGDLPDPTYPTTRASDGPRHIIVPGVHLGATVDTETDGQPNATASGDDAAGDDEDGVRFLTPLMPGTTATIEVIASEDGFLNAWIDWNNDGFLNSTDEYIFQEEPLGDGTNTLSIPVPATADASSLYARFRFTTGENEADTPGGEAPNGEVEDYVLMSLGDTVWLDNGADSGIPNNGQQDGGEPGVPGVTVELIQNGSVVATTETDANGNYLFMGLNPGDYTVHIPASNFAPNGPLAGLISSAGAGDPNAGVDQDADENGVDNDAPATNGISSAPVTLALGQAPTSEDGDANSNLTVDFSFVRFDLALRKTVQSLSQTPLVPGASTVTFAIEVINQGDVAASNVQVTDYIQSGFTYDQAANPGWSAGPNPTITIPGPIPAGGSETVTIVLGVADGTSGLTLENVAEISNDGQPPNTDIDSTPDANNQEQPVKDDIVDEDAKANPGVDDEDDHDIATTGVAVFDLALRKTASFAPDPIIAGESKITFQIEVFNQGDIDAYEVEITDYVPAGFTYDPADNPSWTQAQTTTPTTTIASIPASESTTVNIVLSVNADVAAQPLVNGAEISAADNNENPEDAPPVDKDSTPDANPGNDKFVDDEINDDGTNDEDDADQATVDVPGVNLGNVVWNDANDNGVLDIGEDGIEGVTLQLFGEGQNPTSDTPLAETTTDQDGVYSFEGLPPGSYFVYIPTPPAGYPASSTATDMSDDGQDNDDNGEQASIGAPTISPVVTLRPGEEPENDGDGSNGDLTLDFGFFAPVNIGDLVWHDANGNGLVDSGEQGIPSVTVELYDAAQTPGVDTPLRTTQTDDSGAYSFENLSPGQYVIYIPQAPGLYPVSSGPTDDNDNGQDNDDNGIQDYAGGPTISPVIELTAGAEPDTPEDGDGTNGDLTVDFGFHAPVSLGNLIWHDVNNNGIVDAGEQGIPGITVQLYAAGDTPGVDAPVAVEVTNQDGVYKFIDLAPGDYFVYIAEPPADYPTSSTNTDEADNGEDNDDNGIQPIGSGPVTSPVVTLTSDGEPTNDGDGPNSDLTLDFGFYRFDLALRKRVISLSDTPLVPGQSTVTFEIEVFNQGDTPVSNVEVIDYVQNGFTYDENLNPGWGAGPNPTTVIPGPIDPGQSATVQIILGVGPGTSGQTLENYAEISNDGQLPGTDIDSTPDSENQDSPVKDDVIDEDAKHNPGVDDEDDHDSSTIGVELFDLALRKRVIAQSDTPLVPGQSTVTFVIEIFNQGDTPASNVTVIDYVPDGFLYDQANNPGWSAGPNPTTVIAGPIEPGQSAAVEITLMVAGGTQGVTLENAAEIMNDGTQGADVDSTPDGANTEQPVKDDVIDEDARDNPGVDDEDDHDIAPVEVGAFDLALRKTVVMTGDGIIAAGDDVTFSIEVFNQGDMAAYNVTVMDFLPSGMSLSPNDNNGWTAVGDNVETVIPGPIAPGESAVIQIVLRAGDETGAMTNEAEIIQAVDVNGVIRDDVDSTPDDIQGNDVQVDDVIDNGEDDEDDNDIAQVEVERFDLALEKTLAEGQPASVGIGSEVEFVITVLNQGTIAAANVVVADYLPTGFTLSPSDNNGWVANGSYVENTIAGPIPPGGSASVSIILLVGEEAAGSVHNTAEILSAVDEEGVAHEDIDSTPDDDPTNDLVVDDEVGDDGTVDEDDQDVEVIDIEGPTAITLASFAAVATDSGVSLMWTTTMELNTLGYQLYRGTSCNWNSAARITQQLIPGQGGQGGSYRYEDGAVLAGITYCYWLVEVETDGDEATYGPVQATVYGSNVRTPLFLPIIYNR